MKKVCVGLVGFGTVGSGVAKILLEKCDALKEKAGVELQLKAIVDVDITSDRGMQLPPGILSDDLDRILDDEEVSIVVELVGGTTTAKDIVLKAIAQGKNVVTANKALLAMHGTEIFDAAFKQGVSVAFEASCAGGIPIIKVLSEGFVGNKINSIVGIVNGTSNYILSHMYRDGFEYARALKQAQKKGYAEKDPTLDVNGRDAAHKLAILARVAFGKDFVFEDIYCEGIDSIHLSDIRYANEMGYVIKLLAIGKDTPGGVELRVIPALIAKDRQLAHVNGVFNAIYINADAIGDGMLYGRGAGQMPTASAIIADVVDTALGRMQVVFKNIAHRLTQSGQARLKSISDIVCSYYLRFTVLDKPGVLAAISGVLGEHNISLSSVIQQEVNKEGPVPLVIMTHEAREKDIQEALVKINTLNVVKAKSVCIRVER